MVIVLFARISIFYKCNIIVLAGCGLFFRCFLGLLCSPASVGLDFGSLVVSVGLVFGCLWILVVVGVFLAFLVLWVLLGLSAVFGRVIEFWVCKCSSYTACVLGRLTLSI
jgi:hypothetical protein